MRCNAKSTHTGNSKSKSKSKVKVKVKKTRLEKGYLEDASFTLTQPVRRPTKLELAKINAKKQLAGFGLLDMATSQDPLYNVDLTDKETRFFI